MNNLEAVRPETIIDLERAALDRWGRGDPDGFLEIMARDITYFDPTTEKRLDGIAAIRALFATIRGKISVDRTELVNPTVIGSCDTAILTTNLISHGGSFAGGPKADARWNTTEVYRRIDGSWKIVHSHWSHTRPDVKMAGV